MINLKTAIFGGAFDPVHKGHIKLAVNVNNFFRFDKFIFMPTKNPPHKASHKASAYDRINMLDLVAKDLGAPFQVSDMEITRDDISYTYDTLKEWKSQNKSADIYFISGSDIFASIGHWHNYDKMFELTRFIVVNRPGVSFHDMKSEIPHDISKMIVSAEDFIKGKEGRVLLLKTDEVDISSTDIRSDLINDASHLPDYILEYIKMKGLYKGNNER